MQLITTLLPLLACTSYVSADALTDYALLRTLVSKVANDVARSLTIPQIDPNATSTNPAFTRPVGLIYVSPQQNRRRPDADRLEHVSSRAKHHFCSPELDPQLRYEPGTAHGDGFQYFEPNRLPDRFRQWQRCEDNGQCLLQRKHSGYRRSPWHCLPETQYIKLITTLAQALVARGRSWHSEENRPVYNGMQNLSQAIYTHSQGLTAPDLISTGSTIRTITASSAIIDGQDAWNAPGWLPGS